MNLEWLRHYVSELKGYITNFEQMLVNSKKKYLSTLQTINDPEIKSYLIKHYELDLDHQIKYINAMKHLCERAQIQLKRMKESTSN